jgi:hypothetical protein
MREKERQGNIPSAGGSGDSGSRLGDLREQADRFLAAGDDAISRALASSDSQAFLRANRQQGGQ